MSCQHSVMQNYMFINVCSAVNTTSIRVLLLCSGSFCYLLKLWRSLKFDLNRMVECYLHWMNSAEGKYEDTSHVAQLWQQLGIILRDLEMFPEVSDAPL